MPPFTSEEQGEGQVRPRRAESKERAKYAPLQAKSKERAKYAPGTQRARRGPGMPPFGEGIKATS